MTACSLSSRGSTNCGLSRHLYAQDTYTHLRTQGSQSTRVLGPGLIRLDNCVIGVGEFGEALCTSHDHAVSHMSRSSSAAGANSARLEARTVMVPRPNSSTRRSTTTSTTRGRQLRSTGHEHLVSTAPFAAARRRASIAGLPAAPNGRNVTGAAASAAASAAAAV